MNAKLGTIAPPTGSGWVWFILALVLLVAHAASFSFVVDDAFISYRYADNLVDGNGLVFNPGERVEGYSNLSWVLLSAVGIAMGLDPLAWARILGILAMAGLLMCLPGTMPLLRPKESKDGSPWPDRALTLVFAALGAVACWMLAGLETPLFTLAAFVGWRFALERNPLGAGLVGLLLVLTRPDGLALAGIFTAWSLLPRPGNGPATRPRRWLGPVLLTTGIIAYFLWRHAYYGWWLPNTYYAKTGDLAGQLRTGIPYGLAFLRAYGATFAVVGIGSYLVSRKRETLGMDLVLSLGLILVWLGYTVLVGGDMLGMYRFFVPVLPIFLTATMALVARTGLLDRAIPAVMVALVLSAALLAPSIWGKERRLIRAHMSWANLGGWMLAGDVMAEKLPAGTTIALGPAGYIPWRTGFRSHDFYGLVDPEIAHLDIEFTHGYAGHEKHDGGAVVRRLPDYILIGNVDVTNGIRDGLIPPLDREVDIVLHPIFQKNYELVHLPLEDGKVLNMFRRKDLGQR